MRICFEHNTRSCAFPLVKLLYSFHAYRFLNELCHRVQLHQNLFGKIAVLFLQRVINCINILYFEDVSKYFLQGAILACDKSQRVFLKPRLSSIKSITVKNTAYLPVLVLNPPGIRPLRTVDLNSFPCPTYLVNSFFNSTLSCNTGLMRAFPK